MLNAVHPAQVAGSFYPAEPEALRALIGKVRQGARPDGGVAPKAVVAPHAGIVYSGAVAATAFSAWARRAEPPKRIVIVGPAHRVAFQGLSIHPATAWSTPLGEAKSPAISMPGLSRRGRRRRRAAVRWRAFARNASRDAAGDDAGPV